MTVNASKLEWYERQEPPPWGTLRLSNYRERFAALSFRVNFNAILTYVLMLLGYFFLVFGELDFYRQLTAKHHAFKVT